MVNKIFIIENILTIKILASTKAFNNIKRYFPNILESKENVDADYQISCFQVDEIPNIYQELGKDYKIIYPFRNAAYIVGKINEKVIAYANRQEYSDENVIIRENNDVTIFVKNDENCKSIVRLIRELVIRKLLEKHYFPLHASCIVENNEASLFIGNKGSGKSTILLNSILINGAHPLSNDITFVGKEDKKWKAFGMSYDLTFDKDLLTYFIKAGNPIAKKNHIDQYSSNKIRYNPQKFCEVFKTIWEWSAPIKSINIRDINSINKENNLKQISFKEALEYLKKYSENDFFSFDDLLMINGLYPNYDYKHLSEDIIFNRIEGNILKHKKTN